MQDTAAPPITEQDMLRQFLHGRDVVCPGCQYNLRDLTGSRCPECGQDLVLQLHLAEPRQSALLTGLIGLSAGAGLNGLLVIYFLMMVFVIERGASGMGWFLGFNLVGLCVHGAAIAVWLRLWRRIRRLSAATRWSLAAAGCGLSLVNIVLFSLTIR